MGVKASYGGGLKPAQPWSCPCSKMMSFDACFKREPKFRDILWEVKPATARGNKAQPLGSPCSKKVYSKTQSQLSPLPFPFSVLSLFYLLFWKLAYRYKCVQPIGEIFPTPPLFLCMRDGQLTTELTMRLGELQSTPAQGPLHHFFFEYSLCSSYSSGKT